MVLGHSNKLECSCVVKTKLASSEPHMRKMQDGPRATLQQTVAALSQAARDCPFLIIGKPMTDTARKVIDPHIIITSNLLHTCGPEDAKGTSRCVSAPHALVRLCHDAWYPHLTPFCGCSLDSHKAERRCTGSCRHPAISWGTSVSYRQANCEGTAA